MVSNQVVVNKQVVVNNQVVVNHQPNWLSTYIGLKCYLFTYMNHEQSTNLVVKYWSQLLSTIMANKLVLSIRDDSR